MENGLTPRFSVSDFLAVTNQTLDMAFGVVEVVGEVASFKLNQQKYVFFDLKDQDGLVGCFMMSFQLRLPIEDGMKVVVRAVPKITKWGKFSLTVQAIKPVGEGSIKKSFEMLKSKLEKEGLFSDERKRLLPAMPERIAVISSVQAAGYGDFIKIINDRWGGLKIDVAHVQVQGDAAADQIVRALKYFNEQETLPEVVVIIRGGGSAEDLAVFNDEVLVREVAASRVPVLSGIGHEVDTTLIDLVADVRAATPSNAAQILVPDKSQVLLRMDQKIKSLTNEYLRAVTTVEERVSEKLNQAMNKVSEQVELDMGRLTSLKRLLDSVNPLNVLERGYALVRGEVKIGESLEVETSRLKFKAKVEEISEK